MSRAALWQRICDYGDLISRGLSLLCWYGIAMIVTVLALGAHQFQLRVIAEDGKPGSAAHSMLAQVIDAHGRYRTAQSTCGQEESKSKATNDDAERDLSRTKSDLAKATRDRDVAKSHRERQFDIFVDQSHAGAPPKDEIEKRPSKLVAFARDIKANEKGVLEDALVKEDAAGIAVRHEESRVREATEKLRLSANELATKQCKSAIDRALEPPWKTTVTIESKTNDSKTIDPKQVESDTQQIKLRGLVLELDAFGKLRPLLANQRDPVWFVQVPNSILTLLLTLAMGALGSTIYLTARSLQFPNMESASAGEAARLPLMWFVLRPSLGMIVALAIYIAFRAGVVTLSATPNSADAGLNPFVISFFALIAGLMSERAIANLMRNSRNVLGESDPAPRFQPTGLSAAMQKDTTKTDKDLAKHMEVSYETARGWIEKGNSVSYAEARKIAKWMGRPEPELFTLEHS